MKKTILTTVGLALMALTPMAASQNLADFGIPAAADDPVAADALREVKAPDAVTNVANKTLGEPVMSGETTGDAINAAVRKMIDSGQTVYFVATKGGHGVVSMGEAHYTSNASNPNIVLIAQRQAYMRAFLEARSEMVMFLEGLSIDGKQELHWQVLATDDPEAAYANTGMSTSEQLSQNAEGMLRGAIVYDLDDDPETGTVKVTIITTPKTQGAIQNVGDGKVVATSLAAGLQAVFTKLKTGIIPPEGGQIVAIPGTGELAWVAWGSDIARKNRTPAVQKVLRKTAKSNAQMRARRALFAVITGEDINAEADLNDQYSEEIKQMETVIDAEGNESTAKLVQDEVSNLAVMAASGAISSITKGELPAGVTINNYASADGNWLYAVAIYTAKATEAAGKLNRSMKANSPLGNAQNAGYQIKPDGSFKVGPDGRLIPASMGKGRVTGDEVLDIIKD